MVLKRSQSQEECLVYIQHGFGLHLKTAYYNVK